MIKRFTTTHSHLWFEGDQWTEVRDPAFIAKIGLPDNIISVFVDTFDYNEHRNLPQANDTTWFQKIWISTDREKYAPARPEQVVMLRHDVSNDEVTAWMLLQPGNVGEPWSASYTCYAIDLKESSAWVLYHGAGSNFTIDKPFRLTGAIEIALLQKICEEESAPLKIVQRSHWKHREIREEELDAQHQRADEQEDNDEEESLA